MKFIKVLKIILIVLLVLLLVMTSAFFILRYTGKKKLFENDKVPVLTPPEVVGSQVDFESTEEDEGTYSVRYNGKKYVYNDSIINLLFMGVDTDTEVKENEYYTHGGQVDVLLLACVDTKNKTVRMISIPRDTVCDVTVYDVYGDIVTTEQLQIALSYAFGDGAEKSCEITSNTVSNLLYGLPIHAWYSINTVAIGIVNDAIGGVEIIPDENNKPYLPSKAVIGEPFLLKSGYAKRFISLRGDFNDSHRRTRQKQYLSAFVKKAKSAVAKNPLIVTDILEKINKYSVTNLSVDEIVWLSTEALDMEINTDFTVLKGEESTNDGKVEYTLDKQALYELMIEIFYVEVE